MPISVFFCVILPFLWFMTYMDLRYGLGRADQQRKWGYMKMRQWHMLKRLLPFMALMLLLSGCGVQGISALDPQGTVAEKQLFLILLSIGIMILVFVVVMIIFTFVILKYRMKKGEEDVIPEQVEGNHKLEIIWTVIPIILLMILAVPTVATTFALAEEAPEEGDALLVKVTAHQFWWEFEYPDLGVVTAQELRIPTNERVYIELTAGDVIHSFWVPALAGKMDNNPRGLDPANPVNLNRMYFDAKQPGEYQGFCTELCGPGHALMFFKVIATERNEFDQWVASMQNFDDTATPNAVAVEEGRALYAANCIACHAVDSSIAGGLGPNLAGFADRTILAGYAPNDAENLAKWIRNPQDYKVGNEMPAFPDLSNSEVNAIVQYLKSLTLE